jgi:hypothetical protein
MISMNAGTILVAIARDDIAMDDEVVLGRRQREELQLIRAFLGIADASKRQRILELAERLADDAESGAAPSSPPAQQVADALGKVPGRIE